MRTYGGNGGGECCSFPFIYKGKRYNECTSVDAARFGLIDLPWCAVTPSYDQDHKRGICIKELGKRTFRTPYSSSVQSGHAVVVLGGIILINYKDEQMFSL